jgi:hypothetical protein
LYCGNIKTGRHSDRGGVFILLFGVMKMRLVDHLSNKEIMNLKSIRKKSKKKMKEKLSRRELIDLMGMNRPTYKRVRGAIRRK